MSVSAPRFLVVSLGNQAPYFDCLHSAGHFALSAAQKALAFSQPPFASERYGKKACMASSGYLTPLSRPSELGLVLVHDELEAALGHVRIRKWEASPRGHNGIKSVKKSLGSPSFPHARWSRISIGIGRPVERTPDVVSDYVLRKMTSHQKQTIDETGPKIIHCLRELQDEWQDSDDAT
ncbi:hypothetical protein NUW58_g10312 [Xylaria curta]|uniref:Uncharacterized protein n=1 Tax=Xylaria curta TaxID=42375 RepID=A0ACC1MN21_9PEZI|nr:hypothetical protein NUW58_g10312 [Xylaria curta]